MSKLSIIVKREYLTRVRKRSFIIGTLLAPLGLLIYMLVIYGLSTYQSGGDVQIAVLDEAAMIRQLPDDKGVQYIMIHDGRSLEQLKPEVTAGKYSGILRIPTFGNLKKKDHTVYYYSDKKLAPEKRSNIEENIAKQIKNFKIDSLKINRESLEILETNIDIDPESITGDGADESKYTAGVGLAIGGIMAFIMFFMVLMYGQMVMRSVMEEKTNRIVEVMMSSVRPFELMMGKIIGAGAVGLTQVVAWVVLSGAVTFLLPLLLPMDATQMQANMPPGAVAIDAEQAQGEAFRMMSELGKQNWPLLITAFIIFFLGGYFIYASLFAAIGSAMSDDLGEGQALTLPVTIPIVLAFYIIAFVGVRNPDSGLMVFASIFPLFSPIVMPFRMAFDPPWWQVAMSLLLVIASSFFFVWLAGRIYRVGILLYGKKVTLKEIGKWMFYKG